ncbi:hypothetical protein A2348_02560 [Candidatus Uhrbacteria bacterium RIFOXYB12_FULL_58_10]|uniref:O-antigen ligase-related domain-containing protein n=1 Tax=Candidatus Uhrbacteria bacterium RIFOXYB2_FULL_57_15 TaxID=1802422 RepID=A0A1F7W8F5_9BACT|nr:MAG: hypothetical protein A2348_02560 [Candidatus Uhrbacteria bacterium RIFOXYB12_FULL_58_10]OGL98507.1 MAG: hypothetical protein A2304_02330 [Candidatus Uhrbacteria bacterium RIFOXYB2_FULL_57_15]OGL99178.1 MAG: hypothetical protein A2501_03205 [Candidatus Uhrbacteria bacterium RIFOXYC12_FULL_57_11]
MSDQFFGKPFFLTLAALASTFLVSILVFSTPILAALALGFFAMATFAIAWKRPELGIAVAFAELFANSHGHLISYAIGGFSLSLRMVIFAAVMLAWVAAVATKRARLTINDPRLAIFIPLIIAIALGFTVGFLQNDPVTAFKDGNAYLYLGYLLPILSVEWDGEKKRLLLQVFAAAATWVVALTLGLLYVFTHFPEWMLGPTYRFIRDTRTGELTKMAGNIFRIFLQAQLSVVFALYLVVPFLFVRSLSRDMWWKLTLVIAALISVVMISLSRSFWVGIIVGDIALLALLWKDVWPGARKLSHAVGSVFVAALFAIVLLVGIVLFPLPYRVGRVGDLTNLFSDRTTDLSDVAISSRWNLLAPLLDEIKASPVLGAGFGEDVTFETDDPRARAINPDGTWTTYALEWGWLELWLKMGILGPVAFLSLFVGLARGLWPYVRSEQSWIGVAFLSSLVMLFATHAFSPYLNHPLGLGMLLLFVPFLKKIPPAIRSEVSVLETLETNAGTQVNTAVSMVE